MTPEAGLSRAARGATLVAFTLSGVAGLLYEVVWARYLALLLGSGAYGQAAVLVTYLGGLALGAFLVGRRASRIGSPLRAYAAVEVGAAAVALLFHPAFLTVSRAVDAGALPGLGAEAFAFRWLIAGLLVLPGALLLGATFPLVAAGLVRESPARPGEEVAAAYLANTLGGAAGVALAGFVAIPRLGLPGALAAGGALSLASAAVVLVAARRAPAARVGPAGGGEAERGAGAGGRGLRGALLAVSFGTAVASLGYEVAWVRMLSLVLGSATHAFDLMLSAFILGLAVGAFLVRPGADRAPAPLRLLGVVQVAMGVAAVATLPLYAWSFEAMAWLVSALRSGEGGYAVFNLSRYALCLLVMLPATTLAGMTLPLLTAAVLRHGGGEGGIGRVYGWNTLGAVAGVVAAALWALPAVGVEGLLLGAALLDVGLGVALLALAAGGAVGGWRTPAAAALIGGAACVTGVALVRPDPVALTGAVFRYGALPAPGTREVLFYRDGRTATVGAYRSLEDGRVVLTTNGKPDASLEARLLSARRDTLPGVPLGEASDATTQLLAPLLALAHAPGAARVANVGHGSGISGAALLAGPAVEEVLTLEIEPAMVEGSRVFLPANRAVFEDPRSRIVHGDARVLLAEGGRGFDLIFSEPSNPWVSGNAGLFTREFYARARRALAPGGVLAQWLQLYEVDDALALSVVAALAETFPWYEAWLVGDRDLLLVAGAEGPLPRPDWAVLDAPAARTLLEGLPVAGPAGLESLHLFGAGAMTRVAREGILPNSDFHPVLEYGAEAARFAGREAEGILAFAGARMDVARTLRGEVVRPDGAVGATLSRGLAPMARLARSAWLQERRAARHAAPPGLESWEADGERVAAFEERLLDPEAPGDWRAWTADFAAAEALLHGGTAGWVDTTFHARVGEALERWAAPGGPRAVVGLLHGVSVRDFPRAAAAADTLWAAGHGGEQWLAAGSLVDASAVAWAGAGRPGAALEMLDGLERSRGAHGIPALRLRWLRAVVEGRGSR